MREEQISIISTSVDIKSDAKVTVMGNDVNRITWSDGNPTNITNAEILARQTELQAEYDALAYARAREAAYPTLKDFAEAYCEKEIGEDSTKWDAYVTAYNKVRSDIAKP